MLQNEAGNTGGRVRGCRLRLTVDNVNADLPGGVCVLQVLKQPPAFLSLKYLSLRGRLMLQTVGPCNCSRGEFKKPKVAKTPTCCCGLSHRSLCLPRATLQQQMCYRKSVEGFAVPCCRQASRGFGHSVRPASHSALLPGASQVSTLLHHLCHITM